MFNWYPEGLNGYELQYGDDIGQIFLWRGNESTVRINWVMVKKKHQRQGIGKSMLEEVKKQVEHYFPGTTTIIFEKVTSMGMLRLIQRVFPDAKQYFSEFIPEDVREQWMKEEIDLPQKSPAKYHADGGCHISKRARFVNIIATIEGSGMSCLS